ncbi:hypothetical protein [Pseudobacteroides cellulosolvens]|uniref:Uncharacterized protein n=1 Tax=Pseudobacteroides cellulosolvens ATCC 35603 = DSM 2933 TaxID=398512 RepID=A0A0L6JSQ3_9FIRM|nr:hypothetical protein [Pseudobacteroides cellulosolvens]KNY28730.1 hypothetical protein Bccel_4004 [Pseudobacteroides cellulosolvens ATCC 35603 = DSM 2933]
MDLKDLKVVSLNITEDNYEYKGLFRLCSDDRCMDADLEKLSDQSFLEEVKVTFNIKDPISVIKSDIMDKVIDASKQESRISQGEHCCNDTSDKKIQRSLDSLNMS